jgi:hypothetical protein
MTLDLLDDAFLRRWQARDQRTAPAPAAMVDTASGVMAPATATSAPRPRPRPRADVPPKRPVSLGPWASLLRQPAPTTPTISDAHEISGFTSDDGRLEANARRLFERAPEQWLALARHVERARQRGLRVIAVAGGERGEGRSTLLACLAEALRQRDHDVVCVEPADVEHAVGGPVGGGVPHDTRIVLVDAGIWFPPGPIQRRRLLFTSLGHDAVILVRRADRPSLEPRAAALESLGIVVLGEVLTFATPEDCDDRRSEAGA